MTGPHSRRPARRTAAAAAVVASLLAALLGMPTGPAAPALASDTVAAPTARAARAELAAAARQVARTEADLGLPTESGLRLLRVGRTAAGPVVRLQQTAGGLPVLAGQVTVALDVDGGRGAVGGEVSRRVVADTFAVPASTAARAARKAVSARHRVPVGSLGAIRPARVLFDASLVDQRRPPGARAAWAVEVADPADPLVRDLVIVDAATRAIAFHVGLVAAATDRVVCDRAEVPSEDPVCRAGGYTRVEGGPPTGTVDVDQAYDNTGATADWFAGRLGVDLTALIGSDQGDGRKLRSTTRYCEPGWCPFDNAFWTGDQMVYGTGFAAADDVVAHELSHGVTDRVAGLLYWYQSGAISESLSDVFAELVDLADGVGNDDVSVRWMLGEDLAAHLGGVARDMSDPPAFDQPDHTASDLYDFAPDYADNGAVHTNSGVPNKAAYLIADGTAAEPGGTFNGHAVAGLGLDKTAAIYWQALHLLTPGSDFADLAAALGDGCALLAATAAAGVVPADCGSVTAAVIATGLTRWAGPGVPRRVRLSTGPRSLAVTWRAPKSAGDSPITSYVVELRADDHPAEFRALDPGSREMRLRRIRPGTAVTFGISAVTADGTSPMVRRAVGGTRLVVTWHRGGDRARARGTLTGSDGAGLVGRVVRLVRLGSDDVVAVTRTRSHGRFRLAGPVRAGRFRVVFEGAERLLGAWSNPHRVT